MDPEVCNDHWDSLSSLLEEAKTMQGVGQYHDHIVNLQGITAIAENSFLTQVNFIYHSLDLFFNSIINKWVYADCEKYIHSHQLSVIVDLGVLFEWRFENIPY